MVIFVHFFSTILVKLAQICAEFKHEIISTKSETNSKHEMTANFKLSRQWVLLLISCLAYCIVYVLFCGY